MKKMIWFTCISILFLLFIVPGLMASFIDMVPAHDQPGYSARTALIYGDRSFTQYFISDEANLVAVATTVKNPNLKNKKDVLFKLYDERNELIRSIKLNGMNIGDGNFVKFIFDKITDSKDKKYYFILSSPGANEEEVIEVFLTEPTNEILKYTYDEEVHSGGAPIVTFHKPNNAWEIVKSVYSNWFSKLLPSGFQKI